MIDCLTKRCLAATLSSLIALSCAGAALAQSSRAEGAQRHWPSQLLPAKPLEARACSCRYAGQNVPIGKTICMTFEHRLVRATCDTVANNPSWSISKDPCPAS